MRRARLLLGLALGLASCSNEVSIPMPPEVEAGENLDSVVASVLVLGASAWSASSMVVRLDWTLVEAPSPGDVHLVPKGEPVGSILEMYTGDVPGLYVLGVVAFDAEGRSSQADYVHVVLTPRPPPHSWGGGVGERFSGRPPSCSPGFPSEGWGATRWRPPSRVAFRGSFGFLRALRSSRCPGRTTAVWPAPSCCSAAVFAGKIAALAAGPGGLSTLWAATALKADSGPAGLLLFRDSADLATGRPRLNAPDELFAQEVESSRSG